MFFEMSLSCHQHPFFKFSHNIHEEVRQLPLTQKKWRIALVYNAIAEKLLCTEGETFMDDKTKTDIDAGVPMVIVHWDENGTTTSQEAYNLEISHCPIGRKSN